VVLPVTGVSLGVVQVVRGVLAQPAAISGYLRGHVWDEVGRRGTGGDREGGRTGGKGGGVPAVYCCAPACVLVAVVRPTTTSLGLFMQWLLLTRVHSPPMPCR
jgi:hypothetical protein